ncbi:MAG: thioredoxin-disulfide reductase [Desulfobulbaceae bacterium]|nr:MAG: thioredoxin-disulfide reductase [Desulfobulbaceae bacterium]
MSNHDYHLIIIGGGPAGLTAGIYAARAMLDAVLLEKGAQGGQVMTTDWIDNYPGFPKGVSGFDLAEQMEAQAKRFDLQVKMATVTKMDLVGPTKTIFLEDGSSLTCRAVLIATGARPNQLGIPGEAQLTGRGVSYCATCDAPFYKGKSVAVIGGGNSAVQEAIYLTKFADKVFVVHRRDSLRATKIVQEKAFANDKIEFILDTVPTEVVGDESGVTGLGLQNTKTEETSSLKLDGVFVLIGIRPNMEMLPLDQLDNDQGFIHTNTEMETSQAGVFAAGDIIYKNFRQVANAVGEGCTAALSAEEYLENNE